MEYVFFTMRRTDIKEEEEDSSKQHSNSFNLPPDENLLALRAWLSSVQPIKLVKLSQDMMTDLLQNWSKFRISVLKYLNQQQNKILDSMAILRKQTQWINQIKLGQFPPPSKITSKLFKQLLEHRQKNISFQLKQMVNQSKLICDKLLDTVKSVFDGIKTSIAGLVNHFREYPQIGGLLVQRTYFGFLKKHHAEIQVISDTAVGCMNQGHDMDFGAVIGPVLTPANYRIALKIQRCDRYQSFVGIGVCHPDIVASNYYKGSGLDSGCYLIRQQSDPTRILSLSHISQKDSSYKKTKQVEWGFGQGDIILIQMDFKRKMVGFSKGGTEHYYQMKVDLGQGSLCPYVVLHSKWDSVAIINQ